MMVRLRDYQADALDQTRELLRRGLRRILLVAPTGAGKTTIAGAMIHGLLKKGKHAHFWAHRKELIDQCSSRLSDMDVPHSVIKGSHKKYNPDLQVQVASIQTLVNRDHHHADLIIVDEAHRSTSRTYVQLIKRYGPEVCIIGLTATPYRLDGQPLGWAKDPDNPEERFDFYQEMVEVSDVQSLIDEGHLIMPTIFGAPPGTPPVDFSKMRKGNGDYTIKSSSAAMQPSILRGDLLKNWATKCGEATGHLPIFDAEGNLVHSDCNACTVVFAPSVKDSKQIAEQFKAVGVSAAHIDGATPDKERDQILQDLRDRKLTVVSNYQILCLDEETEVLTRSGWRNIDSIKLDDRVANWWPHNEQITFSKPESIIRRPRKHGERMVSVAGKRSSIRVTEDHRIGFWKQISYKFDVKKAHELCGQKLIIPISGLCIPERISVKNEEMSEKRRRLLVTKTAYNLRKYNGYSHSDSRTEAELRVERKASLRKKSPHELSNAECAFIGLWLGDGSCTKLQSGGVEYSISQSMATPRTV